MEEEQEEVGDCGASVHLLLLLRAVVQQVEGGRLGDGVLEGSWKDCSFFYYIFFC